MLTLAAILAITISTSDNSGFFTIPSWMPRAVSATQTPGSENFIAHETITTNDSAALYAVFNGYCERCYYLNNGRRNSWDTSQYGPTVASWFWTPADLGDRSVAPSRAVCGMDRMNAIAGKLKFDNFFCYRPGWYESAHGTRQFCVASKSLMIDKNKGSGNPPSWELLDGGELPHFSWQSAPGYGDLWPCDTFRGLRNFGPDGIFNSDESEEGEQNLTKTICYLTLKEIAHGCDDGYWSGRSDGCSSVATTFAESMRHAFGTNCNVYAAIHPTNTLDQVQPWMRETGRILSQMDRSYSSVRVSPAQNAVTTYTGASRSGSYTYNGTITVEVISGLAFIYDQITVSSNDWSSGAITTSTEVVSNSSYVGSHAVDINVGDVGLYKYARAKHSLPREGAHGADVDYILSFFPSPGEGECDVSIRFRGGSPDIYADITSSEGWTTEAGPIMQDGTYTIDGFELSSAVARNYSYMRTVGGVRNDYATYIRNDKGFGDYEDNKYVIYASNLVNDNSSDACNPGWPYVGFGTMETEWMAVNGSGAGVGLTNAVNALDANVRARLTNRCQARWGDFTDPVEYAYVAPNEVKLNATIGGPEAEQGEIAVHFHDGGFYTGTYDSGGLRNVKWIDDGGWTNIISQGYISRSYELSGAQLTITVPVTFGTFNITETNRPAHRACSDAVLFQRQDFKFNSLRPNN